jgi:hypothetical protein
LLEWSYAQAENDVSPKHLETAAEQLTLHRDKIHVVDAQNLKKEDESEKQESPEEPEESELKGKKKRSRAGKSAPQRNRKIPIRNESESLAHCFWAEGSDKRPSTQYLRPNLSRLFTTSSGALHRAGEGPRAAR